MQRKNLNRKLVVNYDFQSIAFGQNVRIDPKTEQIFVKELVGFCIFRDVRKMNL